MTDTTLTAMTKRATLTLNWRGNTARLPDLVFAEECTPPAAMPTLGRSAPTPRQAPVHNLMYSHDPVDLCLSFWKEWMHQNDRARQGQTMRGLAGDSDGYGQDDIYEAQRQADMRMAQAVDACIASLSRLHSWAIHRACSMATVWRFPQADLASTMQEARLALEQQLRKNICTAVLF